MFLKELSSGKAYDIVSIVERVCGRGALCSKTCQGNSHGEISRLRYITESANFAQVLSCGSRTPWFFQKESFEMQQNLGVSFW